MSKLLVPIILFISAIGLFFTYLSPGYATLQAIQAQADRVKKAEQDFLEVVQKKSRLTDEYVKFKQKDLDTLKLTTPPKVDVVQMVIILDKLAQENKLYVEEFGIPSNDGTVNTIPRDTDQVVEYGTATFQITFTGSYEATKQFLYQVERSAMLMDVKEVTIIPSDEEEYAGMLTFSIIINTYWLY